MASPCPLELNGSPDGSVSADGLAAGTYMHGMFEHPEARYALVRALAREEAQRWTIPQRALEPGQTSHTCPGVR